MMLVLLPVFHGMFVPSGSIFGFLHILFLLIDYAHLETQLLLEVSIWTFQFRLLSNKNSDVILSKFKPLMLLSCLYV
uniref:Uncharacterized protein n=1 Tax=Arundo donax TaxID=35708 RepID=A0A0A8Y8T9_ARUDO